MSTVTTLHRITAFVVPTLLWSLAADDALAYIDPGTGSMLLQMGAAAFAAGLFYLRGFRTWLSGLFRGKRPNDSDHRP
jgi:hypothetical protein